MTDRGTSHYWLRLRNSEIRAAAVAPDAWCCRSRAVRGRSSARRLIAAATVLSVGTVVAGCGRPAPSAPQGRPDRVGVSVVVRSPTVTATGGLSWTASEIDSGDPDAVLIAAAGVLYSYAPVIDANAAQAFDRARPLLSRSCQQRVGASTTGFARITGATWQRWRTDRAVLTAEATVGRDDHPPDTATTHPRVVTVTQTVHSTPAGLAGTTSDPIVLYMVAGRDESTGGWRVSRLAVR